MVSDVTETNNKPVTMEYIRRTPESVLMFFYIQFENLYLTKKIQNEKT